MESIKILDKEFVPYLSEAEIQSRIQILGKQMSADYVGKSPVFLGVLNGCFRFVSDLITHVDLTCEINFIKLSSYSGTETTGEVKEVSGLNSDLTNRDVIIVEDIVDTGTTMDYLMKIMADHNPASVKIASLLYKPTAYKGSHAIDYCGFEIPNLFVVGYGLDYDEIGRNLNEIYQIKS